MAGILELLRNEVARVGRSHLLGLADGAAHAVRPGGENQFGAVGLEQHATFAAHRFRHDEGALDAARRAHHRQTDAGIARGRFEHDGVGADLARRFCRVEHRGGDAVLDAVRRIEEFELERERRVDALGDPVKAHQWRVADQFGDVVGDFHYVNVVPDEEGDPPV